jgi:MFS family permease
MLVKRHSNYRWYLLALTMATYGVITGLDRMCMPVLFNEIARDLNLSMVAVGTVWGADPLAGVFIGLPSGLLADRFGVKKTLIVLCVTAGIFGALRGLTVNFLTMALVMFLFGLTAASTPSVVPKMTAEWFSGKQLGLANALINVAWATGSMTATMLSATVIAPAIGGWRNVMFLYGVPTVLLGLLWLVAGKEPQTRDRPDMPLIRHVPFKESLGHVLRNKAVWLIGGIEMTNWGANMGFLGYLPLYLERTLGWSTAAASGTVTIIAGIGLLGAIPMVMIAQRTSMKVVLTLSLISLGLSIALVPLFDGAAIYLLIIFGGLMRSGATALFSVMIFETDGIGSTYGGTAIGLANAIAMLGAFAAPPLGNSLTSISPGAPLFFWGCLAAAGLPFLYMVKGRKPLVSLKVKTKS